MQRAAYLAKASVFGLLLSISGYGCGGAHKSPPPPPSAFQLKTIAMAYAEATDRLDHPPESKEEFLPYLKDIIKDNKEWTNPEDILRSKNDGQEFVIHWGVDCRDLQGLPQKMPVVAYEKTGQDGKRQVLQGRRWVRVVSDDEFAELPFPQGAKRPN
jgi:hypothetical protein